MPNFNEMRLLNSFLLVFSALVTLFLLIGSVTDVNRTRTFMKHFIILLISNLFMQLGEAGIWFFGGVPENVTVLKVSALMSFVFSYVLIKQKEGTLSLLQVLPIQMVILSFILRP